MSDIEDTIRSSELDCLSRIAGVEQDIFLTVLRHLDCVSLSQLELTCHSIYNIIQQSEIWRRKYEEAQEEIEVLERERRLNFRQEFLHLDNYPESLYKKVLIKKESVVRKFRVGKCRKSKTSFYDIIGFNGDMSVIQSMDCSSIFVHDEEMLNKTFIHDLHTGHQSSAQPRTYPGFRISHSSICAGSVALLREPLDDDEDDADLNPALNVIVLEVYSSNKGLGSFVKLEAQSNLLPNMRNKIVNMKLFVCNDNATMTTIHMSDPHLKVTFFKAFPDKSILVMKELTLSFDPQSPYLYTANRFVVMLKKDFLVWASTVHCKKLLVWDLRGDSDVEVEPVWVKSTSDLTSTTFPPVSVSSFDLAWPHLLVGGSDGRCGVWDCQKDVKIRDIEHDIDSGNNVGWRQVTMAPTSSVIVSLAECGWLTGWDKARVLDRRPAAVTDLRLWRINTRHESPVVSFVMNSSRIVSLERHALTSEWDVRSMLVIRDFWRYDEKRKKTVEKREKTAKYFKKRKKLIKA